MDERVLFGTKNTTVLTHLHNTTTSTTYSFRQSTPACFQAVSTGASQDSVRVFTTLQNKALLHVYNVQQGNSGSSSGVGGAGHGSSSHIEVNVAQRIPLVEPVDKFVILEGKYLLGTSASGGAVGGVYVWDMESGELLKFHQGMHYQTIGGFVVSADGKFLLTYADDARCCVWEVRDLLSGGAGTQDKLKPVAVLKDHSLPITRVEVVGEYIFTSSLDMSVRCYGWAEQGFQNLKTFTFSSRVTDIKVDSALRSFYAVLDRASEGQSVVYQVPLLYNLSSSGITGNDSGSSDLKIVNLLNSAQNQKIYTCSHIFDIDEREHNSRVKSFQMNGHVVCSKVYEGFPVSKIQLSLDNTVLLVGLQKLGKILCMDIFSKQILKELSSNDPSDVLDIQIQPIIKGNIGVIPAGNTNSAESNFKYPNFSKNLNDTNEYADVNIINTKNSTSAESNIVFDDFETYMNDFVSKGQHLFQQSAFVSSTVSTTQQSVSTFSNENEKDTKIKELQETVDKLTKAYRDLRSMYSEESA